MIKPVHIRIILYYCIIMSICSNKLLSHLTHTILYSFEGVGMEGTGGHAVPMMDNGVTRELSPEIVVPPVGSRGCMLISLYFALLHIIRVYDLLDCVSFLIQRAYNALII
jgi:hypothetical protein